MFIETQVLAVAVDTARVAPLSGIAENVVIVAGAVKDIVVHTFVLFAAHGIFVHHNARKLAKQAKTLASDAYHGKHEALESALASDVGNDVDLI